jgi:uncharacterized membrane protein
MVEEIKMRKREDIIATITSICILPFTVSLVYGMYKLTCLNDLYFIWLMSSFMVLMFIFWGTSKRG